MSHAQRLARRFGRQDPRSLRRLAPALIAGAGLILLGCSLAQGMRPAFGKWMAATSTSSGLVSPVPTELASPDRIDLARGASLFSSHCASCHGASGRGDGPLAAQFSSPVPAFNSPEVVRPASPSQWFGIVTHGDLPKLMPPFGDVLNSADRWDVTYYALTLGVPPASLAQAESLYLQRCASCHGDEGQGDGPAAKRLRAPLPDLSQPSALVGASAQDLFDLISQGTPLGMPSSSTDLTVAERWSLVWYVRSLAESPSAPGLPVPGGDPTGAPSPMPSAVPAAGSRVRITGRVTNGTTQKPAAHVAVEVRSFTGAAVSAELGTWTDGQGNFQLPGVVLSTGQSVAAAVTYLGVTYTSGVKSAPPDASSLSLPVVVYDTTTDASRLSMDEQSIFVESIPGQGVFRVGVLAVFSNPGRTTIVAPKAGAGILTFDLPDGARALQFGDGAAGSRYLLTASGFEDTQAILPGSSSHEVLYSYELPVARMVSLQFPAHYPLAGEVILVPPTLRVQSDQLVDTGPQQIQGGIYEQYVSGSLSPGQTLDFTVLSQFQNPLGTGSPPTLFVLVGIGLLALGLACLGLYLWPRWRASAGRISQAVSDREALLRTIAALDDAREAGALEEEAYRIRRQELKARLMDMSGMGESDLK